MICVVVAVRRALYFIALMLAPIAASAAEPPPLEAYGELPVIEDISISRGGNIAILATSDGKRVLAMLDRDAQPISVTEVGDIKVRDLTWIGEEAVMIQRSDTRELGENFIGDNFEFFNALIVPVDTQKKAQYVFEGDRSMLQAVFGWHGFRNVGGKLTGYFSGIPMKMGQRQYYFDGGSPALYAVDIASNKSKRIASAPLEAETADWLIDPRGEVAATLVQNQRTDAWRLLNSRGQQIASGVEPKGGASIASFGTDPAKVVYFVSNAADETKLFQVPLAGGAEPEALFPDTMIDTVFRDPDSGRMIGYEPSDQEENDDPVFFEAAATDRRGRVLTSFAKVGGRLQGFSPDFTRVLVRTDGNNDSGTWYLVDTETWQVHVLGRSRPQIGPQHVGPIAAITYKAQDGLEIEAILTLPPAREAKNLPLVVFPHGGPQAHDEVSFDWWAQAFASRGYAVLQPNFRGSTGYGDEFKRAGNGEWGRKMQTDLTDGIANLAAQGMVDPKRVCIMGASYGGYAALAGVTLQQSFYRCAVSVAGVSDLKLFVDREFRESGSRDRRELREELIGPRETMDAVSPRRFADKADAPILLVHGRDDTVVPYQQSTVMADALRNAGKPYKLVELREEDHWLSRSNTRKQMLEVAMDFIQEHNPPD